MFGYKVYINYVLWKIGLRHTLPKDIINSIQIKDNCEKMVDIRKFGFVFEKKLAKAPIYLRESVAKKLQSAQKLLPKDTFFKIYSAYRSLDEQEKLWNKKILQLKKTHKNYSKIKLEYLAVKSVAKPTQNGGGHQTGGAVDISVCNQFGKDLDMGGKYLQFDENTPTKKMLTPARKLLLMTLQKYGLVNYPQEWWHFCYGDRMWAAYSKKTHAIYGSIKK